MRGLAKAAAIACLSLTATLGSASLAFSQEEGVTLDPGDPAAKEYALPHEEARREAGGAPDAPVRQGSRDSARFGEGVEPDMPSGKASTGAKAADRSGAPGPAMSENSSDDADTTSERAALAAGADADGGSGNSGSDGGMNATTALVGGGAAALFAALLGGFGLRAVRGPRDA